MEKAKVMENKSSSMKRATWEDKSNSLIYYVFTLRFVDYMQIKKKKRMTVKL